MNQNDELRDFSNTKSLSVGCWVSVGLLGNSNSLTYKNSYESVLISIILHTGALRKALLTGWLDGWLVRPQLRLWGPPMFGKKKKPVSSYDTPFMSDGARGGGRVGGEEMVERGSSSRKRGRGVKWRQVFHDKPYNPPPLLYSSSLHQLVHRECSKLAQEQTLVSHFPLSCYRLLFAFIQPPYPSDLI